VVVATFVVAWATVATSPALLENEGGQFVALTATAALLGVVGVIDDLRSLPAVMRLAIQCVAVGALIAALPHQLRVLPQVPWWLERVGLLVGGVWLVNLVNFMDGIDWMTVAEAVPITAAMILLGLAGVVPPLAMLVALALLGAALGFAPFNRPVARLFLGDVGSLPTGLVLGWLLLILATSGHLVAALLLPLYYLADSTITLGMRMFRREAVWEAHRTHFYQRAVAGGMTVPDVVARVFAVNVVLAALAMLSIAADSTITSWLCLIGGATVVGLLLVHFARGRR
jgi:UDP-N-acetylmuramyl pentapeptide phosphotransferase/UDP-N-acetylglucosamine-1-phosphate transferase